METMVSALLSLVQSSISFSGGCLYSAVPRYFLSSAVHEGQLRFQIGRDPCPHSCTSCFLLELYMAMSLQVSLPCALVLALYVHVHFVALFRCQDPISCWNVTAWGCSGYPTASVCSSFHRALQILHAVETLIVTLCINFSCSYFLCLEWLANIDEWHSHWMSEQ